MQNSIPTAEDFVSLVDSGLNQLDDGLNLGTGTAGPVTIGTTTSNQTLTVNGTAMAKTFMLAAPPGDPAPILTTRTIPAGQGPANESTEVILFHSDDPSNGSGPDYITLRAPAIRLQTYNSSVNANIDNAATSNTRLNIDPTGAITAFGGVTIGVAAALQPLTVNGLVTANNGLTVRGAGVTIGVAASAAGVTPVVAEALQPLTVNGPVTANNGLTVTGTGTLGFGSTTRQMLNLWSTTYGIGIQRNTLYQRTLGNFAWYRGGSHNDDELNAGGGTVLMTLNAEGLDVNVAMIADELVTAKKGLTVTGAGVTIGVAASAAGITPVVVAALQPLTVNGLLTATSLTLGTGTVSATKIINSLPATVATDENTTLPTAKAIRDHVSTAVTSASITSSTNINANAITAGGMVMANNGLTVRGAGVTIGVAASAAGITPVVVAALQPLTVNGSLTATSLTLGAGTVSATKIINSLPATAATDENTTLPTAKAIRDHVSTVASAKITSSTNIDANTIKANALLTASAGLAISGAISTSTTNPKEWLTVGGPMTVSGLVKANNGLTVSGNLSAGDTTINTGNTLSFGQPNNQIINLYTTAYGIGIQSNTVYYRTQNYHTWFLGGSHINGFGPGEGGTTLMRLNGDGLDVNVALTASELVKANKGLTVAGAGVTIGVTGAPQPLTVNGSLTATSLTLGTGTVSATKIINTLPATAATDENTTLPTAKAIRDHVSTAVTSASITPSTNLSAGTITASGLVKADNGLTVSSGTTTVGALVGGTLSFGSSNGQKINLYSTTDGIGIQGSGMYQRSSSNFAWYRGGTHNDAVLNNGGGTTLMTLNAEGLNVNVALTASELVKANKGLTVSGGTTTVEMVNASSASISGNVSAGSVKIGTSTTTATSIVDSIPATPTGTTLPTTKAVRDLVNQTMPIGAIIMWSGTGNPPTGWALCDGSNSTPDLRNRFVLGSGTRTVRNTGGSESVTLTTSQIPAHSHAASTGNAGNHSHTTTTGNQTKGSIPFYGTIGTESLLGTNSSSTTGTGGDHTHPITVTNTGGGAAHDNMPPYYVLAYIIRVT